MMETLLGRATPSSLKKKWKYENWKAERAIYIAEKHLQAYKIGETNFSTFVEDVSKALNKAENSIDFSRDKFLRHLIEQAIHSSPPKRRRGRPKWIQEAAIALVPVVKAREKLLINKVIAEKNGTLTVFHRVSEILSEAGIHAPALSIRKWWEFRNH